MTASPSPAVGVIGVGRMGLGICGRLVERGFLVIATDARAQQRVAIRELGAEWVDGSVAVAERCDRILTLLPGAAEVQALAPELLAAMRPGTTWIEMSTATPEVAHRLAELAHRRGVHLLEAPMGGGPPQARAGELTLFVGGSDSQLATHRDLTDAVAARVLHVGGPGSGYLVKLLANLLWFGQAVAGAEALAIADASGLSAERVRAALAQSAGGSRFMDREARSLLAGDDLPAFSLAGCVEELRAVAGLADGLGVTLPLTDHVTRRYEEALQHYGDRDGELLAARLVAERAGAMFSR